MISNKCKECHKAHPNAKSREEVLVVNKNKARTLSEEVVKEIVYNILEDAGIKRVSCDKCGNLFFKRSPAQKQCSKCKVEETVNAN